MVGEPDERGACFARSGTYTLRLHIDDAGVPQDRLDIGFYDRTVSITEV